MKHLLLWFVLVCCNLPAQAQTGWLRRFPALYNLFSVQPLSDGYALIASTSTQVYQVRVNLAGVTQDSIALGPIPDDIVPASDGGFFKGFLVGDTMRLQKLGNGGELLWEQSLADSLPQKNLLLVAAPDGSCYVLSVIHSLPPYEVWATLVRRLTGDGTTLWSLTKDSFIPWSNYTSRSIADAIVLKDSSCVMMVNEYQSGLIGTGRLFQVKPDGSTGELYAYMAPPNWGYAHSSSLFLVRPVAAKSLLVFGSKYAAAGDFHPATYSWGFSTLVTQQVTGTTNVSQVEYPASSFSQSAIYGIQPIIAAPMPDGDMVVVEKQQYMATLHRSDWKWEETAWQRPLTGIGAYNGGLDENKIKFPNRLLYGLSDHGAILGGADNAGIFLMKIGLWGNDTTSSFLPFSGQVVEDK